MRRRASAAQNAGPGMPTQRWRRNSGSFGSARRRGLDHALGHDLAADHQHHVVQPAGHHRIADVEGVAAGRSSRPTCCRPGCRWIAESSTTSLPFRPQPLPPEKRELAAATAWIWRHDTPASCSAAVDRAAAQLGDRLVADDRIAGLAEAVQPTPSTATSCMEVTLSVSPPHFARPAMYETANSLHRRGTE
jgi:hypothetical protein